MSLKHISAAVTAYQKLSDDEKKVFKTEVRKKRGRGKKKAGAPRKKRVSKAAKRVAKPPKRKKKAKGGEAQPPWAPGGATDPLKDIKEE